MKNLAGKIDDYNDALMRFYIKHHIASTVYFDAISYDIKTGQTCALRPRFIHGYISLLIKLSYALLTVSFSPDNVKELNSIRLNLLEDLEECIEPYLKQNE